MPERSRKASKQKMLDKMEKIEDTFPYVIWGYIGIMEKKMETTGIIGVILYHPCSISFSMFFSV